MLAACHQICGLSVLSSLLVRNFLPNLSPEKQVCVRACVCVQEHEVPAVPHSQKSPSLAEGRIQWVTGGGQGETWKGPLPGSEVATQLGSGQPTPQRRELLLEHSRARQPPCPSPSQNPLPWLFMERAQNQQRVSPQRQALQVRLQNSVTCSWKVWLLKVPPRAGHCPSAGHASHQCILTTAL